MGALDNKNFPGQSSISGGNVKEYTAPVLYQDAADKLICLKAVSKPTLSSLPASFKTIEDVDGVDVNKTVQLQKNGENRVLN